MWLKTFEAREPGSVRRLLRAPKELFCLVCDLFSFSSKILVIVLFPLPRERERESEREREKERTSGTRLKLGFYTSCSDISQKLVAPQIFKSCPKVAHFTKKLLTSCFLSTQKNQFLQLMKVNICISIRIIYLFIYSFLLADISILTEILRLI